MLNFETILRAHDTAIRALASNRTGTHIASADESGIVKYINNLTASPAYQEAMRSLNSSLNDARFATTSDDPTLLVWSFPEDREEHVLPGHGWDVKCFEWHPTMGLLMSDGKDNLLEFSESALEPGLRCCMYLIFCLVLYHIDAVSSSHRHKNPIQALAWAPHGDLFTSVSRNQTARVLDILPMEEWVLLRVHKKEVCCVSGSSSLCSKN